MVKRKLVLDTDVIVDVLRTGGGLMNDVVESVKKGGVGVYVSSVTVLELWAGESFVRQAELIEGLLTNMMVIPLDTGLAKYIGEVKRGKEMGIQLSDLIIGISAMWIKGELVTKNKKHFEQIPGIKFWKE